MYRIFYICAGLLLIYPLTTLSEVEPSDTEIIVTTATRSDILHQELVGNTSRIDDEQIELTAAQHMNQILSASSGVWLSRGNGQESLLSVRSPVLTGAGSCAEFLSLQDGIPLRSPGFCNVNQLFDSSFEFARAIEVVKGVNSARYGGSAIHGLVNVMTPVDALPTSIALELGPNQYHRFDGQGSWQTHHSVTNVALTVSDDGGYKDSSGYQQQKLMLSQSMDDWNNWAIQNNFTLSHLDQETAGYLQAGEDAYLDRNLARTNAFPNAYRDAFSLRLHSRWLTEIEGRAWQITPYFRKNHMDFLMHFLPGTPVESNGHSSFGLQANVSEALTETWDWRIGMDWEYTEGELQQSQENETQTDSDFLNAVLPQGTHYDYQVDANSIATYFQLTWQATNKLKLQSALRFDHIEYDYDNALATGRNREDGTPCSFSGCRYTRPASSKDSFGDASMEMAAAYRLSQPLQVYIKWDRGFRAPHTSELYRLQNGQSTADIDSVIAKQWELGLRGITKDWFFELSAFELKKDNGIYLDSDRQYLNGLNTTHVGSELDLKWHMHPLFSWQANLSYAKHTYESNAVNSDGSILNLTGNDIDTAPRWIASNRFNWQLLKNTQIQFEWQYLDRYFLDAENTQSYPGHQLAHLRIVSELTRALTLSLRVNNLFNEAYVERADFAFGNHRYFVGEDRGGLIKVKYEF
ncbi:MAG: TonB-dependent receptor [Pseudomonadota bacterium]